MPGLVLITITSFFAGRLSARVGPTLTLRLGVAIGTIGMGGLALSHAGPREVILWTAILYVGVGGAFGAMPTIILQAVPPSQSGQSAAINIIIRMAGSAIGVQLAATIVTATIGAGGTPTDGGYTTAFALATAAGCAALVASLAIPRALPAVREPAAAQAQPG